MRNENEYCLKKSKESERKESERKESERKESERKESERKESERKESERKESERKESERNLSFEALVCFFCGFSRDASLDVWMKFRLSSDTQTSRCAFRPSAHRYNHHSERYNKSFMNSNKSIRSYILN